MPGFRPWRAVTAAACGHMASMAVAGAAMAFRLPLDRPLLQWGAGVLLVAALACRFRGGHAIAGQAGMALWGFITATAHGAGFALMPALVPVCGTGASGTLLQVLLAMGLPMAAMLAANGAVFYLAGRLAQWLRA